MSQTSLRLAVDIGRLADVIFQERLVGDTVDRFLIKRRTFEVPCASQDLGKEIPLIALRQAIERPKKIPHWLTHHSSFGQSTHPTEPSIWSWMSLFISTAYSMGSSLTRGSMKPLTIRVDDSASESPRLIR